jgi:hypothetical protein
VLFVKTVLVLTSILPWSNPGFLLDPILFGLRGRSVFGAALAPVRPFSSYTLAKYCRSTGSATLVFNSFHTKRFCLVQNFNFQYIALLAYNLKHTYILHILLFLFLKQRLFERIFFNQGYVSSFRLDPDPFFQIPDPIPQHF